MQQPTEAALKSMGLLPDEYTTVSNTEVIQGLVEDNQAPAVQQASITVDLGGLDDDNADYIPVQNEQLEEAAGVECPTWLNAKGSKLEVQLYSSKCLKCPWLIETATSAVNRKDTPQCHVTFGNTRCSAATMTIKLTGKNEDKVQRLSIAILMAKASKDPAKVQLALQRLSEESEEVQFKVFEKVNLI